MDTVGPAPEAIGDLVTVKGAIPPGEAGITDEHIHLWIGRVAGAPPDVPVLDDGEAIAAELADYRQDGGRTILDCQPGGCGRDARMLLQLSQSSDVHIVACEATLGETSIWLLEAAAQACLDTGAAMEVHTERGSHSERTITLLQEFGLPLQRVVLCHMDKRPDEHVWPLLDRMVHHGLDANVAIATDLADARMWARLGRGPGLVGWVSVLIPRLHGLGFEAATVEGLVGGNIAGRLARPSAKEYTVGRRA